MSESDQEQSSPEPLSPRTAAVRAGLRRNYSSSSTESRSCESESSSKMAEIPNNNNNVGGGAALVVQPRKPLCEFSIPKVTDQPSCIVYPQLTVDRFELKSGMIHLLPTYYGNTTEDPYMHIKQFFEIFIWWGLSKIQSLELCNTPTTPFMNELGMKLNCPISWTNRYRIESKTWGTS
ncbi:unnamed protein product [Prunus brigantina]